MADASEKPKSSAWSPLREPTFRTLWIAALASNIGTWMHDVGAAWQLTSLSPSPMLVSLLQTATSLPFFFLAVPAGALADVVDRRRLLLFTQSWMCVVAALIALLSWFGLLSAELLLVLTFALGLGASLNMPAWQAVTPELVPRSELPAAAALGAVSVNVGRAVGPAIGGLIVAASGPASVFALNAVSFAIFAGAIHRWRREVTPNVLPAERVFGAMRAGLRYVRFAPELRAVLVRTAAFMLFGNAFWALLPLIGRNELGLSATGYGLLLGCLGIGAVFGTAVLPRLREKISSDLIVVGASVLWALLMLAFAFVRDLTVLRLLMGFGGLAWIAIVSTVNAAAQATVPNWVRGRALAVNLLVFQGSIACGSILWGFVASQSSIRTTLIIAAALELAALVVALRYRLPSIEKMDLTPSRHWPTPTMAEEPGSDSGPVLVTVEYKIEPENADAFFKACHKLRTLRRRDGAVSWGVFQDIADKKLWIETFVVESWIEHLRQHERFTHEDQNVEALVRSFLMSNESPIVRHFVAPK